VPIEKAEAICNYISKLQEVVTPLHELLLDTPGDYILNSLVIKQQLNILSSAFHIENGFSETTTSSSIKDILKPPEPIKRKTKRRYKILNYGIFTSDEVLNDIENAEKDKENKEQEKEEKKKIREEKKAIQEKIKQIKKEDAVEKKEIKDREKEARKKVQDSRKSMQQKIKEIKKEKAETESNVPQLNLKKKRGRPAKKNN